MMTEGAPESGPAPPSPQEVDDALVDETDADPKAGELLVEQIEEAQDSAT
jgi:hypothetical protein